MARNGPCVCRSRQRGVGAMSEINRVRSVLRLVYGSRRYRITRDGEIHIYGPMPNADTVGWYLYGRLDDLRTLVRINMLEDMAFPREDA